MEGLINLTSDRTTVVTVAGKDWKIRPWKMRHYAEMEQYILSLRKDGGKGHGFATLSEVSEFESSPHGLAWMLWKCLEPEHPEINCVAAAYEWIDAAGKEYLAKVLSIVGIAQEKDQVKNSDTPGMPGQEEAGPPGHN